jgi:hypothetical protein
MMTSTSNTTALLKLTVNLLNSHSRSLTRREIVNLLRYSEDLSPSVYKELYKMRHLLKNQVKSERRGQWGKFYYLTSKGQQYFLGDV